MIADYRSRPYSMPVSAFPSLQTGVAPCSDAAASQTCDRPKGAIPTTEIPSLLSN